MNGARKLILAAGLSAVTVLTGYGMHTRLPAPRKAQMGKSPDVEMPMGKQTPEEKLASAERAAKSFRLYLRSVGLEKLDAADIERVDEASELRILAYSASRGPLPKPEALKEAVVKNFLEVGGGSGLMLSSDGYFITAHHVFNGKPKVRVKYSGAALEARYVCGIAGHDTAIGKMELKGAQEFKVAGIRFAPLEKLRSGTYVEVVGQVYGKLYRQVGRIIDPDVNTNVAGGRGKQGTLYYSTMTLTAYAEPGFSGGPVYLKETGELAGFTSYTANDHSFSGVARADHFLRMLNECGDLGLKALREKYGAKDARKAPGAPGSQPAHK